MIVELDQLCVELAGRAVLRDITAHIAPRDLVVLIGANAAGKSTLIRTISGHRVPRSGAVRWDTASVRRHAEAVSPDRLPRMLSGRQAIALTAQALGSASVETALAYAARVGLEAMLDRPIGAYSLGTRQKLCISLSLVGPAALYSWDETISGLDLLSESRTLQFLREHLDTTAAAALVATHNLDIAQQHADQVWLLHEGRLVKAWAAEELSAMRGHGRSLATAVLDQIGRVDAGGEVVAIPPTAARAAPPSRTAVART